MAASAFQALVVTTLYLIVVSVIVATVGPYTLDEEIAFSATDLPTTASVSCTGNCSNSQDVQDSSSSISFVFDFLTFQVDGFDSLSGYLNLFFIVLPVLLGIGYTILAYVRGWGA